MSESSTTPNPTANAPNPGDATAAPAKNVRPPTPRNCRSFIRRKTADAMPAIVEAFVKEATEGSVRHFATLAKVGGFDKPAPDPPPRRRGKSLARRMLDEVERFEARHGIQPPAHYEEPAEYDEPEEPGETETQPGETSPEETV
jgi:hypothetical protein